MKKTLCMLLITAMLFTLIPMVVFAAPTGTAVSTLDELKAMKNNGTYYLANDITITGEWNFLPGATANPWKWENGTLDGNGHTIYYADGTTIIGGFVREAYNITIKNLNIVQLGNTTYIGTDNGGEVSPLFRRLVGGTITITDVNIYANVVMTQANTAEQGGGFVSQIHQPTTLRMTRCVFSGSITKNWTESANKGVAGMLGGSWSDFAQNVYMNNCINYADITSTSSAGGFFGNYRGNNPKSGSMGFRTLEVINCINYGDITSTNLDAGGFFGYFNTNPNATNNFKYNVNYGSIKGKRVGAFGGCFAMPSNSSYTMHGMVNYGALQGTQYVNDILGSITYSDNDQSKVTRNNNTNFAHADVKITSASAGSGATKMENGDAAACKSLNDTFGSSNGSFVLLPNGKITLTWAKEAGYGAETVGSADTAFVGAQLSGAATDATRNVRFVGGIDAVSAEALENVGVLIIATYGDNQTKTFEGQTATVYESILANGQEIFAADNGVDYFYTAVVENIPTNLGTVTFKVLTYQMVDGAVVYSNPTTLTVDMAA